MRVKIGNKEITANYEMTIETEGHTFKISEGVSGELILYKTNGALTLKPIDSEKLQIE